MDSLLLVAGEAGFSGSHLSDRLMRQKKSNLLR